MTSLSLQSEWAWCNKCQGLFWSGGITKSVCPAGGHHVNVGSSDYLLLGETTVTPPSEKLQTTSTNAQFSPFDYPAISESPVFKGNNTFVRQNMWNHTTLPNMTQTLYCYDPGNWWVIANAAAGNTAVITGPDVQQLFYNSHQVDQALSAYTEISSDYAITFPSGNAIDGEANYDCWLNPGPTATGGSYAVNGNWNLEVMVWVYTVNQRPAGTNMGSVTIGGVVYDFWQKLKTKNGYVSGTWSFVKQNALSGTVDLLAVFNWLMNNGHIPSDSLLTDVEFGFEICSTGGVPQTFKVDNYTLATAPLYGP